MKKTVLVFFILLGLGWYLPSACSTLCISPQEREKMVALSENVGFFESHPFVVELMVFPGFLLLWAMAMASPVAYQTIKTEHWNWPDNNPIGTSYTDISVPKEPASSQEIFRWLKWITVGYIAFRLTCLSTFLPAIYQFMGGILDIFFRQISGG